jgi:uncharacterized membrane protein YgdD (TMEM256/DUF423 family)
MGALWHYGNILMSDKILTILAALNMIIGVGAGAFGAHGLKRILSTEALAVWQIGVLYQLVHALGLFVIVLLGPRMGSPLLSAAGAVMFAGIVMFSGSLYLISLTGIRWIGPITPVGGVAFLVAWAMVGVSAWRQLQ